MKVPVVGEFLGPYEIIRTLGSGAVGQVYAAYDESLDREIAVKVLRAQFSDDFQRRERFEREAKAIAALDHPNIVTVYSVEEDDGTHFITMQLVEGTTLDELVPPTGLGIDRFLDLALRLVEAVAAAHQKGIVHRDLKPSNVMVADDGRLKVLDFGLAKLWVDAAGTEALMKRDSMALTLEGQIIGTVAYMSPEQAEGRAADHRSDIFSLGVLMYEMATGEAPFDGDTPISVMSSIIRDVPRPIDRTKPGLPTHLARIIRTCLAKDPVRRYQTAIDLRNALDDLKAELQSDDSNNRVHAEMSWPRQVVSVAATAPRRVGWKVAAVGAAVAFAAGFWWGNSRLLVAVGAADRPAAEATMAARLTSQAGLAGSPAYAPDGAKIVYASDVAGTMDLWVQEADGRTARVTDFPGDETDPDWAPNDSAVAYTQNFGNDGIQLISAFGGQAAQLTTFGSHPKWSPDGTRIVFQWRGNVWIVATQGGSEPVLLVRDTAGNPRPVWSADGERVYYWHRSEADVYVIPEGGGNGEPLALVPTGQEAAGLATAADGSYLVMSLGPYGGNKDLWKVALDNDGNPAGEPRRLTWPTTDDIDPALSPDGRSMAYAARRVVRHLWAYGYDAATGRHTGESRQLTTAADSNYYPAVSADGEQLVWTAHRTSDHGLLYSMALDLRVENKATTVWDRPIREIGGAFSPNGTDLVFASTAGGSYELWRARCTADCVATQLTETQHPVRDVLPSWTPDGSRVIFYSNRAGNWDIWAMALGNGAEMRRLTEQVSFEMYPTLSPSGRQLSFWTNRNDAGGDVWVADSSTGGGSRPAAVSDAQEGWAAWSPDERWFFFASDRSGSFNIWAQPAAGGEPFQVTHFASLDNGMPEAVIYTKFAVTAGEIIIPVEGRSGGLWMLEDISR